MLHTNTPLHTVETHLQFCKSITNVNVCLKSQLWLGAVWSLPEVVAMAFSVLWLSRVGAGVWRLSYSTFIYYTQTKHHKTQSQSNLFLQPFLVLMYLVFPFCAISVFMSVSSGSFPKNYYLITDYNFCYFVFCFFFCENVSPSFPQDFITCI